MRHHAHRPRPTMRRGVNNEVGTGRKRVRVGVKGEGLGEQGEVVVTGGGGGSRGGGGAAAAEGEAEEGEAAGGP